jgi:outer membrane protein assembly factor BamB
MAGGLALNNGVLFYAPAYSVGLPATQLPFASGVFAFNTSTGAKVAYHASTPYSRLSADDSRVYLVENTNKLVALAQSDLHQVWSVAVTNPGEQAPVIANGLVIIGTATDVEAYDASTGAKSWSSAAMNGAAAHWYSTYQGGTCGTVQIPVAYGPTTTIAAALGSRTLVVTAYDGIHILALGTGVDLWHARVTGIPGNVGNPVIVNDPAKGAVVYVEDYGKVYALSVPPVPAVIARRR